MKVLFLGNSHTFFNDMPQIFADICKEKGKDVQVSMQAHPGVTYGWHYNQLTELRFALLHGGFDYLVMQQAAHSPCPSKEETHADASKILQLARDCGVIPIQTMPWAEKYNPAHQQEMYDIYYQLAEKEGVKLSPVGNVFEEVFLHYPEINMYWNDGEHASSYGSYAIALCTYATIFQESVQSISANSYNTYPVSAEDWQLVKEGFAAAAKDPNNKDLAAKASQTYKKYIKPINNVAQAKVKLDPAKAQILQTLVDKFAL